MNKQTVNVVGIECFAVIINDGQHVIRTAIHLRLNEQFFTGQSFDGISNPIKSVV